VQHPLVAVQRQVAHLIPEEAMPLGAEVEMESDSVVGQQGRRALGQPATELEAELAQAVLQGAEGAEADPNVCLVWIQAASSHGRCGGSALHGG
jgi:hypothetical protein